MMTHEAESEVNAIGVNKINGCWWMIFVLSCICCLNLFIAHGPQEDWGCDHEKQLHGSEFSCTSLKEQGAEERGCTKDFSHVLKLLYFLGNKAMLIQHFLCDLYSIRPAAIDITLSKTVINFQQRKIDLYLEYLSPFSGQEGRIITVIFIDSTTEAIFLLPKAWHYLSLGGQVPRSK